MQTQEVRFDLTPYHAVHGDCTEHTYRTWVFESAEDYVQGRHRLDHLFVYCGPLAEAKHAAAIYFAASDVPEVVVLAEGGRA